jgi:hypothetical protein
MRRFAWLLTLAVTALVLTGCVYDPYTGTYRPCCGYYGYPYSGYPYYRYPPPYAPYGYTQAPTAPPPQGQPGPYPPAGPPGGYPPPPGQPPYRPGP